MIYYFYSGKKKREKVFNIVKALNEESLKSMLLQDGIKITKYKKLFETKDFLKDKTIITLANQMSLMLSSGLNVTEALDIYIKNCTQDLKFILLQVQKNMNEGLTLSSAFLKTGVFPYLFTQTISMGEETGNLDKSFQYIKEFYTNDSFIKKKMKSITLYPKMVFIVLIAATIGLTVWVLPKFAAMYGDFNTQLPFITRIYMRIGGVFIYGWWIILLAIIGVLAGYKIYKRKSLNSKNLDRFLLVMPIISSVYKKMLVARFSNILALYLKSNSTIQDSLLNSAKILNNDSVYDEFQIAATELLKGKSFYEVVENISIFPDYYRQVIYSGEKAGELQDSLISVAETVNGEVKESLESMETILTPIFVILMAVFLLPAVIAVFSAMYNITGSIQ